MDFKTKQDSPIDFSTPQQPDLKINEDLASQLALMATYIEEDGMGHTYDGVKKQMLIQGRSQILEDIIERDKQFREDTLVEAIRTELVNPNKTPDEVAESLEIATIMAGEDVARPIWEIFQDSSVFDVPGTDPEYLKQQEARWEELENLQGIQTIIDEVKLEAVDPDSGGFQGSAADFFGNVGEMSVPGNYADTIQGLYESVMDEEYNYAGAVILPGEVLHKMKTKFAELPNNAEKIAFAKKAAAYLKENPGLIKDSNGLESMFIMDSLLNTSFNPNEDFDWDRLIENTVGLLDLTYVGGLLGRGIKNTFSALGILGRTNPEQAGKIQAASLMGDTEQAGRALGTSQEEVLRGSHFPSPTKSTLSGAPSDVVAQIDEVQENLLGIFTKYVTENVTQSRRLVELAEGYGSGVLHVNKSTIVEHISDTEKLVRPVVGRTKNSGYRTIKGARMAARMRGIEDELMFYKKSPTTGNLNIMTEKQVANAGDGDYFFAFDRVESIAPDTPFVDLSDIKTVPLVKGGGETLNTRTFYDVFSMFNKGDAGKLAGVEDLKHGVQFQIQQAGRHFDKLKLKEKENVLMYLAKGSEEGRVIPYEEAVAGTDSMRPMTNQEYVAYSNFRAVSDLAYATENARMVDWLKNNDYRYLQGDDGVARYGKLLSPQTDLSEVRGVLNVITGEPMELAENMKQMLARGEGELYALRAREGRAGESGYSKYKYVYVPKEQVQRVRDIPGQALPYIDGYLYRRHTDDFYIEKIDPRVTLDGGATASKAETTVVVGATRTRSDAQTLVEQMKLDLADDIAQGVTLEVRMGRDVIDGLSEGEAAFEFAGMNGLLHKGTRGPMLNKLEGADSGLISVVDSIHSSMNRAAANLSIRPVVEKMEADFVEMFGNKLGLIQRSNDGALRFPLSKNQFIPVTKAEDLAVQKQMLTSWEYINFLSKFEDPATKKWRETLFSFGNWLDDKGWRSKWVSNRLEGAKNRDPLDVLKGLTFTSFLALNPVRQFVVQMSQHSVLASLDPKYVMSGKLYKDTASLLMGASLRTNEKMWKSSVEGLARARGLSVKEYTAEVDNWMKSGLPSGVDSHNFLADMTFDTTELAGRTGADRAATQVGNVLKAPIRFIRKVGFNAGEVTNLAMSYHVARRRLEKAGKKYTPEDITNDARGISFGMNRNAEFTYQRGWFKAATQFFQMQHKAGLIVANAATGGRVGNRFFTPSEARRIAFLQMGLYGMNGLGLYSLASWGAEQYESMTGEPMSDELREAWIGGTGTYLMNQMLSTIEGQENTRIDTSSFAPLSGSNLLGESVLNFLFKSNELGVEALMGASFAFLKKQNESWSLAYDLLQYPDPEIGMDNKILSAMKVIGAGLSSGLNNYYKGALAAQEGFFRDKHGSPTVRATALEGYAKMIAGLGTFDEKEYYRLRTDVAELGKARRQQARITARQIKSLFKGSKDADTSALHEQLVGTTAYLGLLPKEEREALRPLLFEELVRMETSAPAADKLLDRLVMGDTETFLKLQSKLMSVVKDEKQADAVRKITEYLNAEPETDYNAQEEEQ